MSSPKKKKRPTIHTTFRKAKRDAIRGNRPADSKVDMPSATVPFQGWRDRQIQELLMEEMRLKLQEQRRRLNMPPGARGRAKKIVA